MIIYDKPLLSSDELTIMTARCGAWCNSDNFSSFMDHNSTSKLLKPLTIELKPHESVLMRLGASVEKASDVVTYHGLDAMMPLLELASSRSYVEYWCDNSTVSNGSKNGSEHIHYAHSGQHLVLYFDWDDAPIFEVTTDVYQQAYQYSRELGFGHLLRTWNYLNDIHGQEKGMERYQAFCVARHEVMESLGQLDKPNPAATAIGGHNGRNCFVFLFSKQHGQVIENKRQISAWEYPKKYSPKQPRFSRAMRYGDLLMCSGTASVVGHETIHLENLEAQLEECLTNIQALLDTSQITVKLKTGLFRFYLRDVSMVEQVVAFLKQRDIEFFVILEGDICRENLLIECEAVFQKK